MIAQKKPYDKPAIGVYQATFTQTATNNPIVTVQNNTIGNIVWTRSSVGVYIGTLEGAFTIGKTVIEPFGGNASAGRIVQRPPDGVTGGAPSINIRAENTDQILVRVFQTTANNTAVEFSAQGGEIPINIKIYK